MGNWDLRTEEGRNNARKEHKEEISKLQVLRDAEQEKISKLISENQEDITKRDEIETKIRKKKNTGKTFIILALIAAVVGYFTEIIISIAGVPVLILGIIIFSGWKKFKGDLDKYNNILAVFDQKYAELNSEKSKYQGKINEHENALADIALKEKYAKVDDWIDSVSKGCVGLYVTEEVHTLDDKPSEPKAKKYKYEGLFRGGEVYLNDMVYGNLTRSYNRKRTFDVFRVDEEGTQKMEIALQYQFGTAGSPYTWVSQPTPVKLNQSSKFIWCHISLCGKGTQVFASTYDTMEAFLEDTGITKDELMEMFL
ncbi:MAG: hypothetical protein E7260_11860 [Lachnospiraceae bacterium]|nr:hypothetical protein [Lachnospiraceae bacterium]